MSHDPEEDLLDHTLRETFSEFDLPPNQHIWAGIEGQLALLPSVRRPLPLKLLLPAVALVGVGVGWLLPRPTFLKQATEKPAPTVVAEPVGLPLQSGPQVAATTPSVPGIAVAPSVVNPANTKSASATVRRRALPPAAVRQSATPLVAVPAVIDLVEPLAVVAVATQLPALDTCLRSPAAAAPDSQAAVASPEQMMEAAAVARFESQQSFRTEFRQPTHRMAERGRGIRRRLSSVALWVRQVVSPHRARTTAQPDF